MIPAGGSPQRWPATDADHSFRNLSQSSPSPVTTHFVFSCVAFSFAALRRRRLPRAVLAFTVTTCAPSPPVHRSISSPELPADHRIPRAQYQRPAESSSGSSNIMCPEWNSSPSPRTCSATCISGKLCRHLSSHQNKKCGVFLVSSPPIHYPTSSPYTPSTYERGLRNRKKVLQLVGYYRMAEVI